MRHAVLVLALVAGAAAAAPAVELALGPRALTEAIDIGQSRIDAVRLRFHEPYRVLVSRAPVDYVDVVTPFRRVALAAEGRARLGDRLFGQREARATLGATPDQIELLVELTFHPQNTYVGVPDYEVRLLGVAAAVAAVDPRSVTRVPRFGPRMDGMPLVYPFPITRPAAPGSAPLTGGTLVVALNGDAVDPKGTYELLVIEKGKELAKARIYLAGLR